MATVNSETTRRGDYALIRVLARCLEIGAIASKPISDAARYDVVIDWKEKLYRVQVKYCSRSPSKTTRTSGSILVPLESISRSGARHRYETSDVDVILVYIPQLDGLFWLGSEIWGGKSAISLRFEPTKSGQSKGVFMAEQFRW